MKIISLFCLLLVVAATAQASHLLGGYIQATPITGSPLTYRISALLYMDEVRGKPAVPFMSYRFIEWPASTSRLSA